MRAAAWLDLGQPVDAAEAATVVEDLLGAVRSLLARCERLEPKCDVCEKPLQGRRADRVVVERSELGAVEFLLGACCEKKPFRVPARARPVVMENE